MVNEDDGRRELSKVSMIRRRSMRTLQRTADIPSLTGLLGFCSFHFFKCSAMKRLYALGARFALAEESLFRRSGSRHVSKQSQNTNNSKSLTFTISTFLRPRICGLGRCLCGSLYNPRFQSSARTREPTRIARRLTRQLARHLFA